MKDIEINRKLRELPAVHELAEELRSEIPDAAPAGRWMNFLKAISRRAAKAQRILKICVICG